MIGSLGKTIKTAITGEKFTVQYPEERESLPDSYRGMLKLDMDTCISCSACAIICPNKTITMVDVITDKGNKIMPQIGIERCLFCALCEEVCPPKCLTLTKNYDYEAYDKRELLKARGSGIVMSVLSLIAFAAAAILTLGSAFMLFVFKKILHAVIALTFAFVGASFLLLLLGQSLLALMLLLVFVGGISTYFVVAVATEQKNKTITSIPFLLILSGIIFIFLTLGALSLGPTSGPALGVDITQVISQAFETQYALLYFMAVLLFATTIGGMLVVKKFTKLLV